MITMITRKRGTDLQNVEKDLLAKTTLVLEQNVTRKCSVDVSRDLILAGCLLLEQSLGRGRRR